MFADQLTNHSLVLFYEQTNVSSFLKNHKMLSHPILMNIELEN